MVENRLRLFARVCWFLLLAVAPAGGLQLPPEVLLDQLLLRVERLIEADDFDAAVPAMEEAFALGEEHDLELPSDYRFQHARLAVAVGLLGTAKESVTKHLAVGSREAESYVEAVALLEDVDRILERRDAPVCSPLPEGAPCWMELTSHPGCFVWNPTPQATETATWTGECSAGFAQGRGTVTWTYRDGEQEHEGNRRYGRSHGESVVRDHAGWVHEGPHRFGKRHGHWSGKDADGDLGEGPYADGERNGHWAMRFVDGTVHEGPFVDGKRHGHWTLMFPDGEVREGPYVDGKAHGHWTFRFPDGQVEERPYVDGKAHGHWTLRFPSGQVEEGPYVDGKRHGHWTLRFPDGQVGEGPYVDGKQHGHWTLRFPNGQVEEGPYVDDEKHGPWIVRPPYGDTFTAVYRRGVRQEP